MGGHFTTYAESIFAAVFVDCALRVIQISREVPVVVAKRFVSVWDFFPASAKSIIIIFQDCQTSLFLSLSRTPIALLLWSGWSGPFFTQHQQLARGEAYYIFRTIIGGISVTRHF